MLACLFEMEKQQLWVCDGAPGSCTEKRMAPCILRPAKDEEGSGEEDTTPAVYRGSRGSRELGHLPHG